MNIFSDKVKVQKLVDSDMARADISHDKSSN